jgi:hypothetical protein
VGIAVASPILFDDSLTALTVMSDRLVIHPFAHSEILNLLSNFSWGGEDDEDGEDLFSGYKLFSSEQIDQLIHKHIGASVRNSVSRNFLGEYFYFIDYRVSANYPNKASLEFSNGDIASILYQGIIDSRSFENFFLAIDDFLSFIHRKYIYIPNCKYEWRCLFAYGPLYHIWYKKKHSDNEEYWKTSTINNVIGNIKQFSFSKVKVFFKKLISEVTVFFKPNVDLNVKVYKDFYFTRWIKKIWLPIFKKSSYVGLWASIRSKWFKKK